MGIKGALSDDTDFDEKLLIVGIKVAIKKESLPKVHAEVKILVYLEHQGLARRMINNIGVSKLCCPGCFTRAAEDLKISVHGQHQKWYPWPFSYSLSQDFPTMEQLLKTRNKCIDSPI